jgi:hypothetical protein
MLDLLGRNTLAAKIFREKFGEEFGHSRVVLELQKYFAAVVLLALNAFFIYFVMIKGVQKGRDWQVQYVTCCLIQVGVDILLFETVECAWLNFLVPQYVHEEVACAAEKLRSLTQRIAGLRTDIEETQQGQEVTKFFLNAPAHLFVSTKLAKKKPQLLESMIVSSYRHHLPGEICKTWPHCSDREETLRLTQARTWLSLLRWVLRGLTLSLQLFVAVPFAYQKVGLRFAQPVVFSGLALVIYSIFTSVVGQVVVGLCGLAAILCMARRWWYGAGSASSAVSTTTAQETEEPTFINDASSSDDSDDMSSEDSASAEEGSDEIEFWNVEYEYGSDTDTTSSVESEGSPDLGDKGSSDGELRDADGEEDSSGYGEPEDPERQYSGSDATEHLEVGGGSYSEGEGSRSDLQELDSNTGTEDGPNSRPVSWDAENGSESDQDSGDSVELLHSERQELNSGSGTEDVLSSEPGSWHSENGSEAPRGQSDHGSDDSMRSLHSELPRQWHGDGEGREDEPGFSQESGGEEARYSDYESEGSVEEDSW